MEKRVHENSISLEEIKAVYYTRLATERREWTIWNQIVASHPSAADCDRMDREASWEEKLCAWQGLLDYLIATKRRVSLDDLQGWIWNELERIAEQRVKSSGTTDADREHIAAAMKLTATATLLDLSTGPATFLRTGEHFRAGREFPSESEREGHLERTPPGLAVDQNVFLVGPRQSDFSTSQPLDDVARDLVESREASGIHCLAGVRGGGKSTVLNRIEWFCNNWIKGSDRPLTVRFDLGCSFDRQKFTMNLMSEICREASRHCKRPPLSCWRPLGIVRDCIGQVGRWCETNVAWAVGVLLVAIVLIAVQQIEKETGPTAAATPATTNAASRNAVASTNSPLVPVAGLTVEADSMLAQKKFLATHAKSFVALVLSLSVLLIGFTHWLFHEQVFRRPSWLFSSAARNTITILLLPAAALLCGAMGWWKQILDTKQWHLNLEHLTLCWVTLIGFLALAQLFLPPWWRAYMRCQLMLEALRGREEGKTPDVPYLSSAMAIFRLMLPQATGQPDVRNMDAPFLEQEIKILLRRCVDDFGGVVVLIDDVDVLPSKSFHELFRLLRPLSKVPGLRCVVCVPRYFHEAFNSNDLGDLHSTAQRIYVLGDPAMFEGPSEGFRFRPNSAREFAPHVERMLRTRLRVNVEWPDPIEPAITPNFLTTAVDRWRNLTADDWGRTRDFLAAVGPTRREILRETQGMVGDTNYRPFADKHSRQQKAEADRLEELKTYYNASENSLNGDVRERAEWARSRQELSTASQKNPRRPRQPRCKTAEPEAKAQAGNGSVSGAGQGTAAFAQVQAPA